MEKINIDELIKQSEGATDVVEETPVQETPQEEVQEKPVSEEQQEEPVNEEPVREDVVNEEPTREEPKEEPVDDFPVDRFGGKFKSWDEVNEALNKEPEYKDDFIKKVVDTYNSKGSLEDFFKAYSTNWKDMPHDDVLKAKFREENPDLDPDIIDYAWEKKIAKEYGDPELLSRPDDDLDADELKEKRYAISMMKKDAEKARQEKIQEQEGYLQPQTDQPKEEPLKFEDVKQRVQKIPEVQSILKDKKLTYKIGDSDFNLEVTDHGKIIDTLADERILVNSFVKDGKLDVKGWVDMVNYYYNGDKVRQALVDHGKTLAREEIINDEYKNTTMKKSPSKPTEETDKAIALAKAFASTGKIR